MPLIQEADGVHRLAVFSPFPVGPTNVYVLTSGPLTLFDCGIRLERTWQELVDGLRSLGRAPDEVEQVVISHAHIDHQGLAHLFPQAEVRCGRGDLSAVRDTALHGSHHLRAVRQQLGPWGIADDERDEVLRAADFASWQGSVPWAEPLDDGTPLVRKASTFVALAMPGHTAGMLNLYRAADGVLLSGDHFLPTITPNPDLYTHSAPVRSGLPDYISSLRRLLSLDVRRVLPGHGLPFEFTEERVWQILDHHEQRLQEVRQTAGSGRSVADITHRLFGPRDPLNRYLALRETFGHLQILCDAGRVARESTGPGGPDLYRAV
jgi:glyoxylase-like metal-dependent hydrolase (beta-lactamase superfamily II)